jgi:ribonuclease BN (tRNA processing enzyme)
MGPGLVEAVRGADEFIAECYTVERRVSFPTNWVVLREHLPEIGAKRVLLTHMSPDMLEQVALEGVDRAEDGIILEI